MTTTDKAKELHAQLVGEVERLVAIYGGTTGVEASARAQVVEGLARDLFGELDT